jgi:hypothetical protein
MAYFRGSGSVEVELARVQSWVEDADPRIDAVEKAQEKVQSDIDGWKGSQRVIIWLIGVNISLMCGLIIALFVWGLDHITLKAHFTDPIYQSFQNTQQLSSDSTIATAPPAPAN